MSDADEEIERLRAELADERSTRLFVEQALLEAKAEAESAARVKADFLANMSHEMRTPLNAIIGFSHLLKQSDLSQKQFEHITRLQRSGESLLRLISDILDFSSIETGRLTLQQSGFVLDNVLDKLSELLAPRAREKGLELHFVLDNDVPQHLVGDGMRLTQVLAALLDNAIKFTESGQVLVFVSVAERDEQTLRLEVAVQDTGLGIPPEQQTRIFRTFAQVEGGATRKYGGVGLGLALSNRLVRLMGGQLSLSSEQGIGSTFLFDIPLEIGTGPLPATSATPHQRALVVDDNAIARTVLSRLLDKLGYQVDVAESGEVALAKVAAAADDPYPIVFLDWNMPGMDGVTVARRLRAEARPAPRIVVVTSAGQSEAEEAFADAQVNGLVLKPVSATGLAAALAEMTQTQDIEPPRHAPRLQGLRVLLVDDVSTNRLIAAEILDSEGALVSEAENGRQAVDKVLNGGPWDVVLMDVQMPEMNGLDATRLIRATPRFATLPILAMTACALEEEKARCLAAGMNHFLTKPIDPEVVIAALLGIERSAATSDAPVSAASTAPTAAPGFPELPGIDTVEGLRRMMNKPAFYEKMLKSFHDRFLNASAVIREHLAAGRLEEARREVHSAKGVAASLSANCVREKAMALENAIAAAEPDAGEKIAEFNIALDEVLEGLRAKFGWPAPQ